MSCKDWYYKYDTLQDCLDDDNFNEIPVDLGEKELEKQLYTTELATTKKTTTSRPTTGSTTKTMTVTVTVETHSDYAEIIGEDFDSGVTTMANIDDFDNEIPHSTELAPENLDTLLKAEVKAKVGVDGKLLTAVFSVELAGGAIMTYLLYKGMKTIGAYLWNTPSQADENFERSNLPLHENQASNPEETIRPTNRDDDTVNTYRTANLDSTRVNETRLTTLSDLSPIGEPQWNRTQSNMDLPSTSRSTKMPKSPSAPILLDLNQSGLDDSLEEPDASNLLGQSILRTAADIIDAPTDKPAPETVTTAAASDNATAAASDNATAAASDTATAATTANVVVNPFHVNNAASNDETSDNERRYPQRNRSAPVRFGYARK